MNRQKNSYLHLVKSFRSFPVTVILISILIPIFGSAVSADTIFADYFTSPGISNAHWAVVSEGDGQPVFSDGMINYSNQSLLYSAFILHSFRNPQCVFTGSAKIICPYPGNGLFLCTSKNSGYLDGIAVITGSGEIHIYEYKNGSQSPLASWSMSSRCARFACSATSRMH